MLEIFRKILLTHNKGRGACKIIIPLEEIREITRKGRGETFHGNQRLQELNGALGNKEKMLKERQFFC